MADSSFIFEADEQDFEQLVMARSDRTPVLVDFWAAWCNPCQMLMPVLAGLAEEYAGGFVLVKVNTEEQQGLAARFGIRSLPTVQLFVQGQKVDEFMGVQPEGEIRAMLDRHIPRESDAQRAQAAKCMATGDIAGAAVLLEQAHAGDPANHRVTLDLADVLVDGGEADRAAQLLEGLPPDQREGGEAKRIRARLFFAEAARGAPAIEELAATVEGGSADSETRYRYAARLVLAGEFETGLDQLIAVLGSDRRYGDDAARRGLLAAFELLGGQGELVQKYRSQMSRLLY